jgi:hypothetical protein
MLVMNSCESDVMGWVIEIIIIFGYFVIIFYYIFFLFFVFLFGLFYPISEQGSSSL